MKKKIAILIGAVLLLSSVSTALAAPTVPTASAVETVMTDGIVESTAMVPLRKVFEDLGAIIEWDHESKTIHIDFPEEDKNVLVDVAEKSALYIGSQIFFEDNMKLVEGRIYVSADFIETVMGGQIELVQNMYKLVVVEEAAPAPAA
ncbi:copper amine oxidase N-terminal domain-containing protein [Paenibacillus harenae]|uniref:copper amine oxidase N-terminal domain-containing protein n=1 Tax=Paenibacillus harenae TaxID=306543 RepID=UPI000421DF73|nr:copper amine oxidase N-terminal domain-containing protein [Paenibacillus harenae]